MLLSTLQKQPEFPTAVKTPQFNVPDIAALPFETLKLPLETVKAPVFIVPVIDGFPVMLAPLETIKHLYLMFL